MTAEPFGEGPHHLSPLTLAAITAPEAALAAETLAAMDPWRRLGYSSSTLERGLGAADPSLARYAARVNGELAGVAAIKRTWLRGPYLELLAFFPGWQGIGLGSLLMSWFLSEAGRAGDNAWVCVSAFNENARRFYAGHGFVETARLEALVRPGEEELLLRRRLR